MSPEILYQQVELARQRLELLRQSAYKSVMASQGLWGMAQEEIPAVLHQLQAAGEALRWQKEALNGIRQAVTAERQRYRGLLDFIPDGYLITNAEGVIQEANQAAAALLGLSQDLLVGKPLAVFIVSEERRSFRARLTQFLAEQGPMTPSQSWEVRLQPRDQTPFEAALTVAPMLNAEAQMVCLRWLVRDITERRQLSEAYQMLVEHSLQGLAIFEAFGQDFRLVFANPALAGIGGYTVDELLSMSSEELRALVHPEDQTFVWERAWDHLAGKPVSPRLEFRVICREGLIQWVEAFANRLEYRGKPALQAAFVEITERKRAEAALQQSEERFAKAFRASSAALSITRLADGCFVNVNESFLRLFGYSREELIGHTSSELHMYINPDERAELVRLLREQGSIREYEMTIRIKSGEVRSVFLSTEEIELDGEAHILAILFDITERKRVEEALRQSEARLDGIISTATDAIISIDANQRIILFNATAEQVFQYQADAVIGQPLDWLLPERFREAHARYVQHFGQTGVTARRMEIMPSELWGRRADGEEFPIEAMISQVEVSGKKFYTVFLRDITKRKQVEAEKERLFQEVSQQRQQLRALTRQLAEAQEVERTQLARELHDQVGQSLTALDLNLNLIWAQFTETALGAGLIQPRLDDSLALVAEMGERIRNVMADLRPPMLDDYGLVEALRWYGSRLAARAGFTITVRGEEPVPRLVTPVENALFRIAQEALTNVAKHAQASQVIVTVVADNGTVRLVIADDGIGFEPGSPAKLFGQQGWGVLTMTERAEAVGGHCRIESQPGQGTRVVVEVAR